MGRVDVGQKTVCSLGRMANKASHRRLTAIVLNLDQVGEGGLPLALADDVLNLFALLLQKINLIAAMLVNPRAQVRDVGLRRLLRELEVTSAMDS